MPALALAIDNPYVTRRYRMMRASFLQPGMHCWLCGRPLIFGLRPGHPQGPTIDHVIPLSRGGPAYDMTLWRPCHHGCNSSRGNRAPIHAIDRQSEEW